MRALVVDDSRAVRMILARTLRELGYEVSEAGDGKEALELLERDPATYQLALVIEKFGDMLKSAPREAVAR